MGNSQTIPVLDHNDKFLSKTTPAKARILVRNNKASIFSSDPFMIKLMDHSNKERTMSNGFFDFYEYMREEKPIYAQNVSNSVLSFGFRTSGGQEVSIMIPNTPKPFCFTDHVSFAMLKESLDLRKMVNKDPKVLKLLEKDEFVGYYQRLADINGTSIDAEMSKGRKAHAGIIDKSRLYAQPTSTPKTIQEMRREAELDTTVEEQPSPRVIGLCAKVGVDVAAEDCLGEDDFIERVMSFDNLNDADLDYIQGKGYYKKVKSWAATQLEKRQLAAK